VLKNAAQKKALAAAGKVLQETQSTQCQLLARLVLR
jgi:hypothetical protein